MSVFLLQSNSWYRVFGTTPKYGWLSISIMIVVEFHGKASEIQLVSASN